ncbi:hypothetical protein [Fredinandcohnia sp. 179-A 10B2 NHS]
MINQDYDAMVKTAKKHIPNYLGENTQDPKKTKKRQNKKMES